MRANQVVKMCPKEVVDRLLRASWNSSDEKKKDFDNDQQSLLSLSIHNINVQPQISSTKNVDVETQTEYLSFEPSDHQLKVDTESSVESICFLQTSFHSMSMCLGDMLNEAEFHTSRSEIMKKSAKRNKKTLQLMQLDGDTCNVIQILNTHL
jgi:hypothetical protein